ncbi:GlxA family transcriptional regulator [Arhodomonas sp. AD133]|uniref:GlxA family transcriptional regulator n=1 Tax=Arhodomonas sp. AD133 TaxID=3415009 RepID=UPI003EBF8304
MHAPVADLHVYVLILDQTHALDLSGPVQVLGAVRELGIAEVALSYVGVSPDANLYQGLSVNALAALPERVPPGAKVLVPGAKWAEGVYRDPDSRRAQAWLRDAAGCEGVEIIAVCSGAFLLAEAGLLDGRRCTTHHTLLGELDRRYPHTRVQADRLFVRDGPITTSAGVSSGIDTTLDVVRRAFGEAAAAMVAQDLAMYIRRTAMDPQHSDLLDRHNHLNPAVHRVQNLLLERPEAKWRMDALASEVNLSPRQLTRLFKRHTGISVKAYHTLVRLERARVLLCHSELSVERIAEAVGFAYPQNFRREWRRQYRQTPTQWRTAAKSRE